MALPRRLFPILLVGAGAALYAMLAPDWPREQHLRIVLGAEQQHVVGVRVRCAREGKEADGEWAREVGFQYARGHAPRIVAYDPSLASGDYLVEVEVETERAAVSTIDRHVHLGGGTTSIDLSSRTVAAIGAPGGAEPSR